MILIAASAKDVAGLNISKEILKQHDFKETSDKFQGRAAYTLWMNGREVRLVILTDESTHAQDLPTFFPNLELVIFISRHSSISGTPTLSVHTPGNLGNAEMGGLPRKVSIAPANAMRNVLLAMKRHKEEMRLDYDVCYEGTHHGPSLDLPTMFVELGSSSREWSDLTAADVVGRAAMEAISKFNEHRVKATLGIGGPHYNAKFTKMALEKQMAFGHIIPKYAISKVDADILKQCTERTSEKVETAILDWKGIKGEDKQPLLQALADAAIPFERA